jgi:hypothetical protein
MPYPHPGWFLVKSAELLESKRVGFLESAKKCKRVRKSVKTGDLLVVASEDWREANSRI